MNQNRIGMPQQLIIKYIEHGIKHALYYIKIEKMNSYKILSVSIFFEYCLTVKTYFLDVDVEFDGMEQVLHIKIPIIDIFKNIDGDGIIELNQWFNKLIEHEFPLFLIAQNKDKKNETR